MLEAILFDLDGCLVDSRSPITQSINFALAELGIPGFSEQALYRYIGPPLRESFEEILSIRGMDRNLADRCVVLYRTRYRSVYLTETTVVTGMAAAVERIASRLPLAVATSKPLALALPLLEALGLAPHFRVVEGPPLDPKGGAERKEATVARAIQGLGVAPGAAAMIGDRYHDIDAGRAHGLFTVGVTWGTGDRAELEGALADHVVATPLELENLLSGR